MLGHILRCFAVFDGHVNASASSHAEQHMLRHLLECGRDAYRLPATTSTRGSNPSRASS